MQLRESLFEGFSFLFQHFGLLKRYIDRPVKIS